MVAGRVQRYEDDIPVEPVCGRSSWLCDAGAARCNRCGREMGRRPLKWAAAAGDAALGWLAARQGRRSRRMAGCRRRRAVAQCRGRGRAGRGVVGVGCVAQDSAARQAVSDAGCGMRRVGEAGSADAWPAQSTCTLCLGAWLRRRIGGGRIPAHCVSRSRQAPDDCRCKNDAASKATQIHHRDIGIGILLAEPLL
jgi:hypothetical protein